MLHITKEFPGIKANDDITLQLRKGEIHALLGENGAGKSTLMSVLFGLYQPEQGTIKKNGKEVKINTPNDANALGMDADGTVILNGPMGATGVTKLSTFISGIILVLIVLFIVQNLVNSRAGRAIKAIRDNRIAAEATGLNVIKYKMMAFVTSAAMAGAAGALYALSYSTVVPKKFDFNTSILILVFVVLGGIGNLRGSIIAAAVLTVLPELLREFQDYRMLVYAIVLILVMLITNNPQAKAVLHRITSKFSRKGKAEEGAGNE